MCVVWCSREKAVRHAGETICFDGFPEGGLDLFWEVWDDDVEEVGFEGPRGGERLHVDQRAGLVGADLVEEDGWVVAHYHMAVVGIRKDDIDQLQPDEGTADFWFSWVAALAEIGGVAVGGDGEGGKVGLVRCRPLWFGDHSEDLPCCFVAENIFGGGLDNRDTIHPALSVTPTARGGVERWYLGAALAAALNFCMNFPW